ncbi:SDR family oxidoreductase [Nocardiopsis sp. NPDC057823]|uniref:SDR family oxidoreductase n=1 Tax=Nocardiopsis sp. NPDC057823 TaxID=3346256 RepID=UPI003670C30E
MIVVTGATGNVGRPLVRALVREGEQVTAVARRLPGADRVAGARYLSADLADPEGLAPALEGAHALYLLVSGAGEGLDPDRILKAAAGAGVGRVVLQSSQAARTRPDSPSHDHLRVFEEALRGSGLEWTVLRPGGFASNAFAWAGPVRERREVRSPFGDVGLPVVDPVDIAEVAARVLRDGAHSGRALELTGPAAVTPRERAAAIADAIGAPVRFVEQTREEARAALLEFMPEVVADGTLAILGEPSQDERRVSPDVERVLGRAPRAFAEWARDNAAAFGGPAGD